MKRVIRKGWSSLSTSSTGSPNERAAARREGARLPWTILALGIVGVLLALYIGTQVLGVFVAILFPPVPPLPPDMASIQHRSSEYGVDDWVYASRVQSPCDAVAYYQEIGATCTLDSSQCQGEGSSIIAPQVPVARCSGETTFSIFAMRWDALIVSGARGYMTEIELSREVFWTGAVPPREFPLPESEDLDDN